MSVAVDEITCPFPKKLNPFESEIQGYARKWIRGQNLLATGEYGYQRYDNFKCVRLAARIFPFIDIIDLKFVTNWVQWFLAYDDFFDQMHQCNVLSEMEQINVRLYEVAKGAHPRLSEHCLIRTLAIQMRKLEAISMEPWRLIFADVLKRYFDANLWNAELQLNGSRPNWNHYLKMRPYISYTYPLIYLSAIFSKVKADNPLLKDHVMMDYLQTTANYLSWCNDTLGLSQDITNDNKMNLVMLIRAMNRTTVSEATTVALKMCQKQLKKLERPLSISLEDLKQGNIHTFLKNLQHLISGYTAWMKESHRYHTGSMPQLSLVQNTSEVAYN